MELTFCGGAAEVGASCYLLRIDDKNILLDAGVRMDSAKDSLPDLRIIQEKGGVDAVFVTHAHLDHTGALPVISREYPNAPIYMTHATKDLVRVLLYDSLKIMEQQEGEIPIYAEVHVKQMLDRIICFSPEYAIQPFKDAELKVTFYHAGHIVGAACVYIQGKEGSVFYSGDISLVNQYTVSGAAIPKLRPDVAILEGTYGDKLHANRQMEEERLIKMVGEVIDRGGKVLVPAFAIGRAQEVILMLRRAMNKGKLPKFKVFVDGMVREVCRVYRLNPNYLHPSLAKRVWRDKEVFFDDWIQPVADRKEREAVLGLSEPCCIISSSGMLTGGPSQWYAERLVGDEKNSIAITGYQDEEAPGRQLLDLANAPCEERFLALGERRIPVKCQVDRYNLSAHADKTELLGLVHALSPRQIFLVHGQEEILQHLGREIQADFWGRIYVPRNGEVYDFHIAQPRKQLSKLSIPSLGKEGIPSEGDIELLWRHILAHGGQKGAYSLEELLNVWAGVDEPAQEQVSKLADVLLHSDYFEPDRWRPFLYRPLSEEQVAERIKETQGPMEVNRMLALVEEFFPPETGLYKKGARFDEKVALLYFKFPKIAAQKYRNEIEQFERLTGWRVELNKECNLEAAEDLLVSLLPEGAYLSGSLSYYRAQGYFKACIEGDVDVEDIIKRFRETTGLDLIIERHTQPETLEPVAAQPGQMEQNRAFKLIEEAFAGKPHKLYKKGLKRDEKGAYIELTFISPEIGEKYRDVISHLEKETGWPMRVNPNPNQNEVIKLARRLLEQRGVRLKKNPSFFQLEKEVRVVPLNEWDYDVFEDVKKEFEYCTGYRLVIEKS
ncbi:putative metal-dependent RNase [Caldicoprobacter guelmensis]|uniref:MBL fold metallo-hydrolase n=1 Tax=Caldicoprobacter guelmensis TaxID=1170224 RepID=UPI0019586EF4|nr:MBL fold metallo-hydrolase [Caldicoprobacter guelmensis]MBM7583080.1 putative metal-dependent RNase [Caldicoprobacter guelmensis]